MKKLICVAILSLVNFGFAMDSSEYEVLCTANEKEPSYEEYEYLCTDGATDYGYDDVDLIRIIEESEEINVE